MLARLEDGFLQLSRFSEDLAHEMRTPLTNLMGQTQQMLSRSRPVEEYQHVLASHQEEYERLANLIANALRHAAPSTTVTIRSTQCARQTVLSVHNQGTLIAGEHLPHLFERFYRCDPSRNQPGDSGGLGLAIVHSIIALHTGQVGVSSSAGGTVFLLVFP